MALRDASHRLIGYVTVQRDVTARKQAEEALRRAHDELEQRAAERTTQLSAINVRAIRTVARVRPTSILPSALPKNAILPK